MVLLYSSAHCCLPPSICRKLFTQAFEADVVRARINAGSTTAIAAITNNSITPAMINLLELRVITPNDQAHAQPPERGVNWNNDV